ncbi:MAG TPA: hypothetical protein VFV66_04400 [Nonomuraea sp.]|nr:hypothetical protein [Nonomuraea sp.]
MDDPYQEGGGFLYENCPDVFLGRSGYGPLRVAWDTNILSDYADYGDLMWADDFDPSVPDPNYHAELIALHALMEIWLMRDIRIKIPERQIHDARRGLDAATWKFRENQINEFLAALRCIELDVEIKNNVRAFDVLPEGSTNDDWDESLVLEAIETGCHVFLTGDKRLRRRLQKNAQAAFLVIMPPTELVAALDRTGDSGFGYMLPDTHKWKHVMGATKPRDADP